MSFYPLATTHVAGKLPYNIYIYICFFPLKPQFIGDFQLPCLTARGYPVRCQLLTSDCWNHQARSYNFQTGDVLVQGSKSLEASMILLASGSSAQKFCSVEIHSVQCVSIQIKDWIVSTFECSIHMKATPEWLCQRERWWTSGFRWNLFFKLQWKRRMAPILSTNSPKCSLTRFYFFCLVFDP